MGTATKLLKEITKKYFTHQNNLKDNINVSLQQIADYEYKLLEIVLEGGNNAITEVIESYIEELKKGANKLFPCVQML